MERTLKKFIKADLPKKIVLISGPRQSGKTTLSKQLSKHYDYFNYDAATDRLELTKQTWDRSAELLIFDELHKMKHWKRWLKGIYDTEGIPPEIIVTGSARLNIHKKVGDSLAGRYFHYRLHPLDLKEITKELKMDRLEAFHRLWNCSGFPEPFLNDSIAFYKRWRRSHTDIILKQDLIDLTAVRDIESIRLLVILLSKRVGNTVSYQNLANDLDRDANTIKRWLQLLEDLYVIYRVPPYSTRIARSLKKESKYYFYDHALVEDEGGRLENIVANALRKELNFLEDTQGLNCSLNMLRTKEGKEIDFLVVIDGKPTHMIEVKASDDNPSPAFHTFGSQLPNCAQIQLVKNLNRNKSLKEGLAIRQLIPWLSDLELKAVGDL
ncbi:MAG: ATP-binding protein [Chlamydiia bacterium]|nr:ATP-binding protein [Chlamydiia bacterium]